MTRIASNRVGLEIDGKLRLFINLGETNLKWIEQARLMGTKPKNYVVAWIFDMYDSCGETGLHKFIKDVRVGAEGIVADKPVRVLEIDLDMNLATFVRWRRAIPEGPRITGI